MTRRIDEIATAAVRISYGNASYQRIYAEMIVKDCCQVIENMSLELADSKFANHYISELKYLFKINEQ
jgi:hypothetical protein